MGDASKEPGHADHDKGPGLGHNGWHDSMEDPTHGPPKGPADDNGGAEHAATTSGTDRKGCRQDFSKSQA